MLCQECKKNKATVHMIRIVNNQKIEAHLCEECARSAEDFIQVPLFSINDLISGFIDMNQSQRTSEKPTSTQCGACGMQYDQFRKIGRLGCQECYKYFENELKPVLERIHGNTRHTGKVPKRTGTELQLKRQVDQLKDELKKSIELEAFERAAQLRDKIKELEFQAQQGEDKNELDK